MLDNLRKKWQDEAEGRLVKKGKTRRRKVVTHQDEETTKLRGDSLPRYPKTWFYGVTKFITEDTDLLELVRDAVEADKMRCEGEDDAGRDSNQDKVADGRDKGRRLDSEDESGVLATNNTKTYPHTTLDSTKDTRDKEWRLDSEDDPCVLPPTNTTTLTPITPQAVQESPPEETSCIVNETSHLGLIGLHTCGNLASSSLRLFVTNPRVKFLCNVGCCYHLLEEEFSRNTYNQRKTPEIMIRDSAADKNETELKSKEDSMLKTPDLMIRDPTADKNKISLIPKEEAQAIFKTSDIDPLRPSQIPNLSYGFPLSSFLRERRFTLGRNARMLSSQAVDRLTQESISGSDALYWRALLQVVLQDKLGDISDLPHVGRLSAKCQTFTEYTRAAMTKLGVSVEVTDEELEEYDRQYSSNKDRLERFFLLRASLAAVVEGAMLLDRMAFLCEQEDVSPYLVTLFDPVTSPRCYSLIAIRDTHTHTHTLTALDP